jgi:putrescine---pyruvate transaminase
MPPSKNLNIAELVAQDTAHHLHPFTDHKALHAEGACASSPMPRAAGHVDLGNGDKVLDGMAGLWCVNIGYGRKELAEVAYADAGAALLQHLLPDRDAAGDRARRSWPR